MPAAGTRSGRGIDHRGQHDARPVWAGQGRDRADPRPPQPTRPQADLGGRRRSNRDPGLRRPARCRRPEPEAVEASIIEGNMMLGLYGPDKVAIELIRDHLSQPGRKRTSAADAVRTAIQDYAARLGAGGQEPNRGATT